LAAATEAGRVPAANVAVVTGASRGLGRGIALALGKAGYVVYVTGRTGTKQTSRWTGTLQQTAEGISESGGTGIAAVCDHSDDAQTRMLFERVKAEYGQLDILVNNAFGMPDEMAAPGVFWERPLEAWRQLIDIGLRSSYVASYFAIPIMVSARRGLIVNTSSPGARAYLHVLPYGVGKVGHDKLAHDMAHELKPFCIAALSLWHGIVKTERTETFCKANPGLLQEFGGVERAESPEFAGYLIDALYRSPDLMSLSGGTFYVSELARRYGVRDTDNREPPSHRALLGAPFYDPVA
jgi:NAD(P)-dependent dehydrogenase (short-subunit alcohol dehydrogenase family)